MSELRTGRKIYSVSEITGLIRAHLEEVYPDITVKGEISNFRPSSTGHYYFSLKDQEALLSVVMFKNRILKLNLKPRDGMIVKATGGLSVYPKRGTYQLICEFMEAAGEGDILALLEERKKKLAAEGLFEMERKKPLPLFPSRVAVVTSPTGAAIRDILRVLKRRNSGINLIILPTPVQGDEAASQIAAQIRCANRYNLADVLIVGRGGGSLEDLLPFYDEAVVRAIVESQIPVISAVGHEVDVTLTDLAADVRAPTPSVAAEIVSASRNDLLRRILELQSVFSESMKRRTERASLFLAAFSRESLERNFRFLIQPSLQRLDDAREAIGYGMGDRLSRTRHRLELITGELRAHSPLDILKRGYAVVRLTETRKVLVSIDQTSIGDSVDIRLYKGGLRAEVKEKEKHEIL